MGEYFTPLRRKVGLLTLVMACALMGAWIRGGIIQDSFIFGDGQGVITRGTMLVWLSASARDGFVWSRTQTESNMTWLAGWKAQPIVSGYLLAPTDSCSRESMSVTDCRWQFCGFEIGRYHGYTKHGEYETFSFWRLSHESIVVPLSLVSIWLLLSMPKTLARFLKWWRETIRRIVSNSALSSDFS